MNYYPAPYSQQNPAAAPVNDSQELNLLWSAVKTGAIIGATGATATGLHQISKQQVGNKEVAQNIIKASATVGVASVAAAAVGILLKKQPALSLLASFATGTAVMYILNKPKLQEAKADE